MDRGSCSLILSRAPPVSFGGHASQGSGASGPQPSLPGALFSEVEGVRGLVRLPV